MGGSSIDGDYVASATSKTIHAGLAAERALHLADLFDITYSIQVFSIEVDIVGLERPSSAHNCGRVAGPCTNRARNTALALVVKPFRGTGPATRNDDLL